MRLIPPQMQPLRNWLGLSALIVVLDLYTKQLVQSSLEYAERVPVTVFFDIVRFHNTGAAFGFLAGAQGWQRILLSVIAIIAAVIIVRLLITHAQQKLFCFALSLVLGGALGNLYDRITLGYVVDFLFFHYQRWYWPAFNVADTAICVGVALLIWDSLRKPATS